MSPEYSSEVFNNNVPSDLFKGVLEMGSLHITTKDERTKELLIDLLHSMHGVEVRETKPVTRNPSASFQQLCGIWKNRNTSLDDIRDKAWRRDSK